MADATQLIFGCPLSVYETLAADCSTAGVIPACATASPIVYDQACCGSLVDYGRIHGSCILNHAPTCLDTSSVLAAASSVVGSGQFTDPCAQYDGSGGAAATAQASAGSSAASTTKASSAASTAGSGSSGSASPASGAATGSAATGTAGTASTPAASGSSGSGSSTTASSSSTSAKSSAVGNVSAGLKVYIGVALISALAVLNL